MFGLAAKSSVEKEPATLESMLVELAKRGTVTLRHATMFTSVYGWRAQLEVSNNGGAVITVDSEYCHKTPLAAVTQLCERVYVLMK